MTEQQLAYLNAERVGTSLTAADLAPKCADSATATDAASRGTEAAQATGARAPKVATAHAVSSEVAGETPSSAMSFADATQPPAPAALHASEASTCGVLRCGEPRAVDVDFVIPVYNEQEQLASSVIMLSDCLRQLAEEGSNFTWQIVIADNASTDRTWELARTLTEKFPFTVRALSLPQKGRGRALKCAWGSSKAQVMAYMDVDLSTDPRQIPELVDPILQGRADVSFASRLLPNSQVKRCLKREFISRTYNRMLQRYLGVRFRDAQCGFKAVSAEAAATLLPLIEDNEWFFDTELLFLAERMGIATNEFAVRWLEDPGSTVHIVDTVRKDLAGMRRLHDAYLTRNGTRPQPRLDCPAAPLRPVIHQTRKPLEAR